MIYLSLLRIKMFKIASFLTILSIQTISIIIDIKLKNEICLHCMIGINVSYMFDQVSLANTIDQYKPIRNCNFGGSIK